MSNIKEKPYPKRSPLVQLSNLVSNQLEGPNENLKDFKVPTANPFPKKSNDTEDNMKKIVISSKESQDENSGYVKCLKNSLEAAMDENDKVCT